VVSVRPIASPDNSVSAARLLFLPNRFPIQVGAGDLETLESDLQSYQIRPSRMQYYSDGQKRRRAIYGGERYV
jgi:hypothetical protein